MVAARSFGRGTVPSHHWIKLDWGMFIAQAWYAIIVPILQSLEYTKEVQI